MIPDPEALLVAALRARSLLWSCGSRIGTRLSGTYPAIRIALVGGPDRPAVGTGRHVLQVECWGNGSTPADETAAADLARAVEDVSASLAGEYAPGRIVASWRDGGIFHAADSTTNRERYIFQVGILTQ